MAHQKVTSDFPTAELPQIRAGEEDRTLVISFESPATSQFNARSDKLGLFRLIERYRVFRFVRMAEPSTCRFRKLCSSAK